MYTECFLEPKGYFGCVSRYNRSTARHICRIVTLCPCCILLESAEGKIEAYPKCGALDLVLEKDRACRWVDIDSECAERLL